jgi:hypothetical protein
LIVKLLKLLYNKTHRSRELSGKMANVAVLGPSFSLRENEPNPCNILIAEEVLRICHKLAQEGHNPVVVNQWEVGLAFRSHGTLLERDSHKELIASGAWPYLEIGQYNDGRYLGTKELINEALPFFAKFNATHFVAVANPFVHQQYTYWLARKHFKLMLRRVNWIGFDKESTQWWCQSWWQFAFQTVRLAFCLPHGYRGRQVKD